MTDGINKESSGQSTDLTCLRTKESLIADVWKQNDCRGRTKSKYPGGGGGRVLLGIFGGGVPPGSPNPDPVSDQKSNFLHLFSNQTSKIHTRF